AVPRIVGTMNDITGRRRAEAERTRLQERQRRLQRVEALGRLAGGVAHDFNNMLTIVLMRAEVALKRLHPNDPSARAFQEIEDAARRPAGLTRQLLTYARREAIEPRIVDLNRLLEAAVPMARQLAGPGPVVEWSPGAGLWPVEIDPS